jgi:4-amino-4-deoxy-L-arabinose transferase-like glycosyltransferase
MKALPEIYEDTMAQAEHHPDQPLFPSFFFMLVAAATLLRLGLSAVLPRVIKYDEGAYLLLGENLWSGNGFTYSGYPELHYPPLQPVVAGLFHRLIGDFEMASNMVYAIFGGLLLFPIFAIARRVYGLETAWVTAVLLAVFPPLTVNVLYWGSMSEPLYLFLLFGGLAFLLAGLEDNRLEKCAAAGALLGLAYLSRPEAIGYFAIFLPVALIWMYNRVKAFTSRISYALASIILPFVVLALPYMWYLHVHTGQWMVSGKTNISWKAGGDRGGAKSLDEMYGSLDSSGEEINWLSQERFNENVLKSVLSDPVGLMRRVIDHAGSLKERFFTSTNFWWGLIPFVVVGLFNQPWRRFRIKHEAFLMTIIFVLMVVVLPFSSFVPYFTPAFPVLLMWTAKGSLELGGWLQQTVESWIEKSLASRHLQLVVNWLPAGLATGALILTLPVAADRSIAATYFGDKEAGLWLKTHTSTNAKVMTQELAPALYSARRYVPSPNTDWTRFMKYARAHEANYLVVRDFKLDKYRPHLASVLQNGTPELELLFSFEEPHRTEEAIKTYVYRFTSPVS